MNIAWINSFNLAGINFSLQIIYQVLYVSNRVQKFRGKNDLLLTFLRLATYEKEGSGVMEFDFVSLKKIRKAWIWEGPAGRMYIRSYCTCKSYRMLRLKIEFASYVLNVQE